MDCTGDMQWMNEMPYDEVDGDDVITTPPHEEVERALPDIPLAMENPRFTALRSQGFSSLGLAQAKERLVSVAKLRAAIKAVETAWSPSLTINTRWPRLHRRRHHHQAGRWGDFSGNWSKSGTVLKRLKRMRPGRVSASLTPPGSGKWLK